MTAVEMLTTLAQATLASSTAVLLVLALRRPLRRVFGAAVAYGAWLLVPVAMFAVLLPAPTLPPAVISIAAPVGSVLPTAITAPAAAVAVERTPALLLVWGLGVVATTVWFALLQWRFRRLLGVVRKRTDGLHQAEATAGLPAALGLWRPKIVVPADFDHRYDEHERRLMRAHEHAHIGRGDLHCNAVAISLRSLFWFNPLLHYAWGRFRHDQELACDQRVIAGHPWARRAYAQVMFKTQLAAQLLPLGCHWGFSHPLKERIEMLKQPTPSLSRLFGGRAFVAALTLVCGFAAWAAQPGHAAASGQNIDVRINVQLNGKTVMTPRVINRSGKPFSVSTDEADAGLQLDMTATALEDGKIMLDTEIHRGGKLVAKPKLVVADAKLGVIEVGTVVDGNSAANDLLRIEVDASTAAERIVPPVEAMATAEGGLPD